MAIDAFMPGEGGAFPNRILLFKDSEDNMEMKLDITIFPLYCNRCEVPLRRFFVHRGSNGGFVGTVKCPHCQSEIEVYDNNDMVEEIRANGELIDFKELYMLDYKYVKRLDEKFAGDATRALISGYKNTELNYLTIDELTRKLSSALTVQITGDMEFSTDDRFGVLPSEINRWIEFLYRSGIDLPANVKVIKEGERLKSIQGSAIWRMHHMDILLSSYPKRKRTPFESAQAEFERKKAAEERVRRLAQLRGENDNLSEKENTIDSDIKNEVAEIKNDKLNDTAEYKDDKLDNETENKNDKLDNETENKNDKLDNETENKNDKSNNVIEAKNDKSNKTKNTGKSSNKKTDANKTNKEGKKNN